MLITTVAIASAGTSSTEHWTASSTTAMSITGNVIFTPSHMTFSNGKFIVIRYLGARPIGSPYGTGPARQLVQLYRIASQAPLRLLRGNALCAKPATFLTFFHSPDAAIPTMTLVVAGFYTGTQPPLRGNAATLCAAFTYVLNQ